MVMVCPEGLSSVLVQSTFGPYPEPWNPGDTITATFDAEIEDG